MFELRDIRAGYDGVSVLHDVTLVVPDHAVVALIGPNGAGKTTLLRVASGTIRPAAGAVLLDGADVTSWGSDARARAGICHVPEGRGVFPGLTVRENLVLQTPRGQADGIDRAVAAFPRLGERLSQRAGSLSGGEQQMLALAHAHIADPTVVLLDEVSMGLAPTIVDTIFDRLRQLADAGTSLLIVEQYVARALALADYVVVLRRGVVEFVGEPWELGTDTILASYLGAAS